MIPIEPCNEDQPHKAHQWWAIHHVSFAGPVTYYWCEGVPGFWGRLRLKIYERLNR